MADRWEAHVMGARLPGYAFDLLCLIESLSFWVSFLQREVVGQGELRNIF